MSSPIADHFSRGCDALAGGDGVTARRAFSAVVALDHEAFDGWLGLHYLARRSPGPILDAMVHCAPRAGELQACTDRTLASSWAPSTHLQLPLLGGRDAHLARIAAHVNEGEAGRAQELLARLESPHSPPVALLWARLHQDAGRHEEALAALSLAIDDPECGPEAERLRGLVLWSAGCAHAALHHLRLAAARAPHLAARLEARYHEAWVCAQMGDADAERRALELIYAERPVYGDVAERLFPERADEIIWQRLVRQLELTPSE